MIARVRVKANNLRKKEGIHRKRAQRKRSLHRSRNSYRNNKRNQNILRISFSLESKSV